jgi:hypothetical protein
MWFAGQLKIWQEHFGKAPPGEGLEYSEAVEQETLQKTAEEFHSYQQEAQRTNNYKVLYKIADAAKLLAEDKLSYELGVTGAALYALRELREESGCLPQHVDQVRKRGWKLLSVKRRGEKHARFSCGFTRRNARAGETEKSQVTKFSREFSTKFSRNFSG